MIEDGSGADLLAEQTLSMTFGGPYVVQTILLPRATAAAIAALRRDVARLSALVVDLEKRLQRAEGREP